MPPKPTMLRQLSSIEEAFTIMNDTHPLVVVCVLHLRNGPTPEKVTAALDQLQQRHPLLQAGITKSKGGYYFERLAPVRELGLTVVEREAATTFRTVAEQALNTGVDRSGPLLECWYLPAPADGPCELIVGFHHAIIDGASARLLLHELLSILGGVNLPAPPPLASPDFPPAFRGRRLGKRLLTFGGGQMKEEWRYRKKGLTAPLPPDSHNATLSLTLPLDTSRQLSLRAGRLGLGMNSVLLAAITLALCRHRYEVRAPRLVRAISFANLRAAMLPPVTRQELGCYISMLRLTVPITPEMPVEQLARQLHRAHFKAGRRREVVLMGIISKFLIKTALRFRNARLGVSGLSFIGKLDLDPEYGSLRLARVDAFITNNRLGPEISAFGKVLFGRISLDFTYLTAEMTSEQAQRIVAEVKELLEQLAESA